MRINKTLLAIAAVSVGTLATQAASSIVYSNATFYSGTYLNPGANEIGDEIILAPGPRFAESFRFEYFGGNFHSGGVTNEQFRLRFYENDGTFIGNNTFLPNSVFYDSGVQALADPTEVDPSGRATYQFDLTYAPIFLPDRFTWSIQFFGIDGGESAGPTLYSPPTVGMSENDYWFNTGTTWELRGTNGIAFNFGSALVATTVPEPSTCVLAIIGGLCGLALVGRRARKT
jgi:hypothetical protein